jgi:dTDP-4-amino-4,6-dideoxygalactose transaminase
MKKIDSKTDLAIFGATPAFKEKLHVGRPNIGSKQEFLKYVDKIYESKWLTNNGPLVQEFEQKIADYHGVQHCIAMCNGTVALEIAIRALELNGEVIIPSYTFIATAHALSWQEITPVFADIDPKTHCLSIESVRKMITPKTSGIIGVHLWGNPSPINELQELSDEFGIKLMFDAAHSFGCSYKGKMIGNFGDAEVLSFHGTKLLNSFEGGAVLTNNSELAEKMKLMRNFGFAGKDSVIHPGTNGKMTEICAAMGLVNLNNIAAVINKNKENYILYKQFLEHLPGINIFTFNESEKNNYQYVVMEVDTNCPASRDEIVAALNAENILARKYFWPGCHNMQPYKKLYPHAGLLLENTEHLAETIIVLPTGSALNEKDIELISKVIETYIGAF